MAEAFDFEKYYSNEKVKTEAAIDRSGVIVQNPTENAECATNNVMYYVSDLFYTWTAGGAFVRVPDNVRICVTVDYNPETGTGSYYYLNRWHALGDVALFGISSTWDPKVDRESEFHVDPAESTGCIYELINDETGTRFTISEFYAVVFPRHETEINASTSERMIAPGTAVDQDVVRDPGMMKLIYGALGFYGGRWKSLKWLTKVVDKGQGKGDGAVISYDRFKRQMDRVADYCSEADVGFSVTYFDDTYADGENDRTSTEMSSSTTFAEAYGAHLSAFMSKNPDLMTNMGDRYGNTTALIPPVKTALKAYFYPADELESNFSSLFKSVMDEISKVPFVWRFVSKSTRRKINKAKARFSAMPYGSQRMAFDMDVIHATMLYYKSSASTLLPMYRWGLPRLIQIGGDDSGSSLIIGAKSNDSFLIQSWIANGDTPEYTFLNYADHEKYNKAYTTISADELIDLLVGYYNNTHDEDHQIDAETVHDKVNRFETEAGTTEYWEWWNDANVSEFALWFMNVCGFMNYFRDGGAGADGIQTGSAVSLAAPIIGRGFNALPPNPTTNARVMPQGEYDIIAWDESVDSDADEWDGYDLFKPSYPEVWKDIASSPYENFGTAMDLVYAMRDAYREMVRATTVQALLLGPVSALKAILALNDISEDLDDLMDTCDKLKWYQRITEESPFTNKSLIEGLGADTLTSSFPAHLMFPVKMYKRVRVKYRNWLGRTRHKTVKRSIGVRWAEVVFTDAAVFGEYPVVMEEPGETVTYSGDYEYQYDDGETLLYPDDIPQNVVEAGSGQATFENGVFPFTVESDAVLVLDGILPEDAGALLSFRIPLAPTKPDGSREPVTIMFKMPSLPYDSEIRRKAFSDYGALSQAAWFEAVRNTGSNPDKKEGWRVFHRSSMDLEDLREGIGIHDKAAMLLSILKHEFGNNRVYLAETYRSMHDQAKLCSGGAESEFLSWHNYGLAVKIMVTKSDGKTPMERTDPEVKRMWEVAKAFTEGCADGLFGPPCNVVWCERLAVAPSLFDWEFLPIGVGHKDAPKFREAVLDQMDPVHELSYVNVDQEGYVSKVPLAGKPYILDKSPALAVAERHGGDRFVSPENIRNFPHVDDIVLFDAREYINLIKLKMGAHGTAMPKSGSIYDWKALNPNSCAQLIRYYAMVGSISASKALLAGDFVEQYQSVDLQYANLSPVDYVRGMLGTHYEDIRVCIDMDGRSSYITLHDGILHVKALDAYPNNPPTRFDMHKQQRVDREHVLWGTWHDGVFYSEEERPVPYIDSDAPVIDGYENGEAVGGEAMLLHQVVAVRIHSRYTEIRSMFENFGGALMYDRAEDSPNESMADMLENEFGLIKAQDLLSFDELKDAMAVFDESTGTEKVKIDGSIYEKVVNNAQLAGIRRASLDKEHIHIRDLPTPDDGKALYDMLVKGNGYMANDLI